MVRGHPAHSSDRAGDTVRLQAFPASGSPERPPGRAPRLWPRVQTEIPLSKKSVIMMTLASPPHTELHLTSQPLYPM